MTTDQADSVNIGKQNVGESDVKPQAKQSEECEVRAHRIPRNIFATPMLSSSMTRAISRKIDELNAYPSRIR